MKKYLFIDHENIGKLEAFNQASFQKIFVFVGALHRSLSIKFINLNESTSLEVIKIKNVGPNNLDFHLSFYLGKLDAEVEPDIEFVVYSKDKGFDHIINYINDNGRICTRMSDIKNVISAKKSDIENKPKTKINKNSQTSSKAISSVKNQPSTQNLSQESSLVIQNLSNQKGNKRPRKKKTIKNHINSIVKNRQRVDQIYKELIENGLITEKDEKISYTLGKLQTEKISISKPDSGLSENAMKIIQTLLKMGNRRPHKEKALQNHFKKLGDLNGNIYIDELIHKNIIKIDKSGKVTYSLESFIK